jgi:hypothetical protein
MCAMAVVAAVARRSGHPGSSRCQMVKTVTSLSVYRRKSLLRGILTNLFLNLKGYSPFAAEI